MSAAADNAAQLIAYARSTGDSVVFIRHEFTTSDAPFFAPGSEGARLHPKAINREDEHVVLKHFANAFRETDLRTVLDQHEINDLTICGNMSHMCVDSTARAACDLGYKVTVIHDACASRDLNFCGVYVPASQVHVAFMASLGLAFASMLTTKEYVCGAAVAKR